MSDNSPHPGKKRWKWKRKNKRQCNMPHFLNGTNDSCQENSDTPHHEVNFTGTRTTTIQVTLHSRDGSDQSSSSSSQSSAPVRQVSAGPTSHCEPATSSAPQSDLSVSVGPPKGLFASVGPPKGLFASVGPPKGLFASVGPPKGLFASVGPPKGLLSSVIPPKAPSASVGPPKGPSASVGPPKGPSASVGPPKGPPASVGPPNALSTSVGPPKEPPASVGPPKEPPASVGPPKAQQGTPGDSKRHFPSAAAGPSTQMNGQRTFSSSSAAGPAKFLAIDCEMVGAGPKGHISQLARCSIVSYNGDVVFDKYICPPLPITDYRTRWSGIRKSDLHGAMPFDQARREILKLLTGKVLVGHAIHNDLKVLNYNHPKALTRDTSRIPLLNAKAGFPEKQPASLKRLTKAIFNRDIQTGRKGHSSLEDAKATMDLYKVVEVEWEQKIASTA